MWFYLANLKSGLIPLRRSTRNAKTNGSKEQALKAVLDSADQQNQSPFFQCLPTELRLAIYTFVLQSQRVHILVHGVNPIYSSDLLPSTVKRSWLEWSAMPCAKLKHMSCFDASRCHSFCSRPCSRLAIGGLFRACRLLYAESVSLLYTNTAFVFINPYTFNELCKAITTNQQFTTSPLRFVRDVRIRINPFSLQHHPGQIGDLYSGLTLLIEQAVTLKRFDLTVPTCGVNTLVASADLWSRETKRLLKEILRILGSFRELETFNLFLPLSQRVGHLLGENDGFVAEEILRELVYLPKGSRAMTVRQFDNHFETRYQALMARKAGKSRTQARKLVRGRTGHARGGSSINHSPQCVLGRATSTK